jgi:hypothetical protein
VGQRTGYPKDMLGLDVDLEADLGIDSIKRIEILSEITSDLGTDVQSMATGVEMEKLTVIRTLRGIIDYLDDSLNRPADPDPTGAAAPSSDLGLQGSNGTASVWGEILPVQRAVVALVDCPLEASPASLLTEGVVLFTDDDRGIARSMADQLADLGQRTVFLGASDDSASERDPGAFRADLTDPEAVADLLHRVREEHGPVSGLIHLAPLAQAVEGEAWDRRAWRDVKALYLLARAPAMTCGGPAGTASPSCSRRPAWGAGSGSRPIPRPAPCRGTAACSGSSSAWPRSGPRCSSARST